jgi:KDO2-lipid IV(A) lauroyltransferase
MSALLRLLTALLALIPLPLQQALGAMLGSLFALFPNRHRRITLQNLALCFPELPERQRARLLILSLRETARTVLETALVWHGSRQRLLGLVREVRGEELFEQALKAGRGVIIASPHLGSWEFIGQYLQARHPLTCMYKPPQNQAINELMLQGRTHLGMQLAPTDAGGIRILLAALKRGEQVGILPDQDPRSGAGVFAPFFGITTKTMTLLPKLAARSGATVLVAYAERLSWGRGYRIHFLPVDAEVNSKDEMAAVTALNQAVEQAIRQSPAQYQWSYKRFRSRPEGEPSLYP